jgi:hypothetical protein
MEEKRPWWPTVTTYPTLVLDDHATEWASQIADDEARVEVDGEEPEAMSVAESVNATQLRDPGDVESTAGYAADQVWSGNLSSGLC